MKDNQKILCKQCGREHREPYMKHCISCRNERKRQSVQWQEMLKENERRVIATGFYH